MNPNILETRIRAANAGGRPAVVPFITAGFPTAERCWEILEELDQAGADIIEIGVPFSDPVADGPMVEEASQRALQNGMTLELLLDELVKRKNRFRAGLALMGYYNPFLKYGLERFARKAAEAGAAGCIVPDLPLEESGPMRRALKEHGLALLPLVGLNTDEKRLADYAAEAEGYAYLASVLGVTGERKGFPPELAAALERAGRAFKIPLALGFGLSKPAQLDGLPVKPQAVVFGSALLRHIDEGGRAADFIKAWL